MSNKSDQHRIQELEKKVAQLSQCVACLSIAQGGLSETRIQSLLRGVPVDGWFMEAIACITDPEVGNKKRGVNRKVGGR